MLRATLWSWPADPALHSFVRMEAYLGLSFTAPDTVLAGHRLAVEAGVPFFQDVAGPQLASTWNIVAGWQWTPP